MSVVEDYIQRCAQVIQANDAGEADKLAREIIVAFHEDIPRIANYRGARLISDGPSYHTVENIKQLQGKLFALQERRDIEQYGSLGLSEITESIRKCEKVLYCGGTKEEARQLCDDLYYTYANTDIDGFSDGLSLMYSSGDERDDFSDLKRIHKKLRAHRDACVRELNKANAAKPSLEVNQTNTLESQTSVNVGINLALTVELIDQIDDSILPEKDKTTLKGEILSLDSEIKTNKKQKAKERFVSIAKWLLDKGVDAFIQLAPLLGQYAGLIG